ncbi:putative potassium transporter 8, partial [Dichanthelium oligosanthes]
TSGDNSDAGDHIPYIPGHRSVLAQATNSGFCLPPLLWIYRSPLLLGVADQVPGGGVAPDPPRAHPNGCDAHLALHDHQEVRVRPAQQGHPGVAPRPGRQARHGPCPRHWPRVHGPDVGRPGQLLPVRDQPPGVPQGAGVRVRQVGAGAVRVPGGAVPDRPRRPAGAPVVPVHREVRVPRRAPGRGLVRDGAGGDTGHVHKAGRVVPVQRGQRAGAGAGGQRAGTAADGDREQPAPAPRELRPPGQHAALGRVHRGDARRRHNGRHRGRRRHGGDQPGAEAGAVLHRQPRAEPGRRGQQQAGSGGAGGAGVGAGVRHSVHPGALARAVQARVVGAEAAGGGRRVQLPAAQLPRPRRGAARTAGVAAGGRHGVRALRLRRRDLFLLNA